MNRSFLKMPGFTADGHFGMQHAPDPLRPFPQRLLLFLSILLALVLTNATSFAQQIKYVTGHNEWNADSLGNHRAIIHVPQAGTAAKVVVEWRRRDDPAGKEIIVVDSATNKRIRNVKADELSRGLGLIYFEPLSGAGTYYIYYMPYQVPPNSNYPNATYLKWGNTPSDSWLSGLQNAVPATVVCFESINALNSFYPMEVIATNREVKDLLTANSTKPYLVFPENRLYPIKMKTDLPQRWISKGVSQTFTDTAARGENFAYQLGIYAFAGGLHNVKVKFSDLESTAGTLSAGLFSCINTDGINWDKSVVRKTVDVPKGTVQAMWCLATIPKRTAAGVYEGMATVTTDGNNSTVIKIRLVISNKITANGGVDEPWKQTRLAWLNSDMGQKNDIIKPYLPLKVQGNTISLLGRKMSIAPNGLPEQIQTYFTEEMTSTGVRPRQVLASPFQWFAQTGDGTPVKWISTKPVITQTEAGEVTWSAINQSSSLLMKVSGSIEFDGFVHYSVRIIALAGQKLKDMGMVIPFKKEVAQYIMGLNLKGEKMPAGGYKWKWDVTHKNQDGAWIGDVNAGLQFSLRDQNYVRPLNTNFYLNKPLLLPTSWGNNGAGGIDITYMANVVAVNNYSGGREMQKGDTLYYNFNLMITPFHALNTEQQWDLRFYHKYNNVDTIKATGATVINIHHGTAINPYINYPFIAYDAMKGYIDSAHALGLKVKIYNTVRELSNSAYEIFPLRSLGHEIYSAGNGGGYSWLQEHLGGDYIAAWYVPEVKDAAIINSGMSRWHNYYVEGMNWLVDKVGIDGIYLDDVAYDRTTMKRIKRVLTQNGHPGIVDLHSANQYNNRDGFNNSTNLYMDNFPYLNRLWFGEYFDYEKKTPDFFLTEVSGIPFGLMGEMLQGGGNPWRGMLFGMTNRMPWSDNADPRPIWEAWDNFGIKGSRMIGYWVKNNPVKTNDADILATVYKKDKKVMVSIASWATADKDIKLSINWKVLQIDPAKAIILAPAIKNFQPAHSFAANDGIPVEKGKGWLLIIQEK